MTVFLSFSWSWNFWRILIDLQTGPEAGDDAGAEVGASVSVSEPRPWRDWRADTNTPSHVSEDGLGQGPGGVADRCWVGAGEPREEEQRWAGARRGVVGVGWENPTPRREESETEAESRVPKSR